MNKPDCSQPSGWRRGARFILLVMLSSLVAVGTAAAQAAAEYAGAVSSVGGATVGTNATKTVEFPTSPKGKSNFRHLPIGISESDEEANRRALEEEAGKDAGTLLLRSVPNKARVWVDGKPVGNTPLLLILPPGGYKVEMRGERLEFAQRQVNLLPEEKREVVFPLKLRYPTQVLLQQSSSIRARE
ncbi:MAG TPA: PEGA domain-containing protein [Candidatus Acidoferrales bacterium]|nr:PEGA domain-containing protein [Candidatus Acidoferrales bacterium]